MKTAWESLIQRDQAVVTRIPAAGLISLPWNNQEEAHQYFLLFPLPRFIFWAKLKQPLSTWSI